MSEVDAELVDSDTDGVFAFVLAVVSRLVRNTVVVFLVVLTGTPRALKQRTACGTQ